LGVREGGVLLAHTSFRAVMPVEGGPLGLIRALRSALGPAGTLVMPTMTDGASRFDPRTTPTDGMGITAELFWRQPGVVRSSHPGASFAAEGPRAAGICAAQPLSPPHGPDSPVGRVHDLDGQVLLLGVTHSETRPCTSRRRLPGCRTRFRTHALSRLKESRKRFSSRRPITVAEASNSPTNGCGVKTSNAKARSEAPTPASARHVTWSPLPSRD
jgi:hypothetical protein